MSYKTVYTIGGIDCAVCAARIQDAVQTIEGIGSANIDLLTNRLEILSEHKMDESLERQVRSAVMEHEPDACFDRHTPDTRRRETPSWAIPVRVVLAIALVIASTRSGEGWSLPIALVAYAISGYDVVYRALRNIVRGSVFDEHFLMTLATVGAIVIGEYAEAVAVMGFYQVGEYFQAIAVNRSRASIADLMDIKPNRANVLRDGKVEDVDVREIRVGDTLLVRAGEKVPVDALVMSGSSSLDTKALTGESVPRSVGEGDRIISGCVNGSGVLHAKALVVYEDSTVATILRLVEESGLRKAKTERFITRFARIYTPVVVISAVLLVLIGTLAGGSFDVWLYRALVFLVISCPCALVVSVPLGFFGGIGGLARMGVLVKGGQYIQALAGASTVVFDKTGTLTEGTFTVTQVESLDPAYDGQRVLSLAASLESHSTHPLARAVVDAHGAQLVPAAQVHEQAGRGVSGIVGGKEVLAGSARFLREQLSDHAAVTDDRDTEIWVALDARPIGRITLADTVKRESRGAVEALVNLGIGDVVMLSGDSPTAVAAIAREVGITTTHARLLPQDKLEHVERLLESRGNEGSVVFVGDGVNDAPVLARADVGIAMGALGSDAAIEAADVVIMTDNLARIPEAIAHSRRTMAIIRQNIVFALALKALVMALGAAGFASMWLAVFADTGVALLAILNALRALRTRS